MRLKSITILALVCILSNMTGERVLAAITSEQVKKIVERANILDPRYCKVLGTAISENGAAVAIQVYRNPNAQANDCKIDTVLLAKKIMEADPQGIKVVKVQFYDTKRHGYYWEVEAGQAQVKGFGAGAVETEGLLASIPFRESGIKDVRSILTVYPGPAEEDRAALLHRLRILSKHHLENGMSTQPLNQFVDYFSSIENLVKSGCREEKVKPYIDQLHTQLTTYKEAVNKAIDKENQVRSVKETTVSKRPVSVVPLPSKYLDGTSRKAMRGTPGESGETQDQLFQAAIWKTLTAKHPEFVPASGGKQYERRLQIGRMLIRLKEEGQLDSGYLSEFRLLEQAAFGKDDKLLENHLSYLESRLGLFSLPATAK